MASRREFFIRAEAAFVALSPTLTRTIEVAGAALTENHPVAQPEAVTRAISYVPELKTLRPTSYDTFQTPYRTVTWVNFTDYPVNPQAFRNLHASLGRYAGTAGIYTTTDRRATPFSIIQEGHTEHALFVLPKHFPFTADESEAYASAPADIIPMGTGVTLQIGQARVSFVRPVDLPYDSIQKQLLPTDASQLNAALIAEMCQGTLVTLGTDQNIDGNAQEAVCNSLSLAAQMATQKPTISHEKYLILQGQLVNGNLNNIAFPKRMYEQLATRLVEEPTQSTR